MMYTNIQPVVKRARRRHIGPMLANGRNFVARMYIHWVNIGPTYRINSVIDWQLVTNQPLDNHLFTYERGHFLTHLECWNSALTYIVQLKHFWCITLIF